MATSGDVKYLSVNYNRSCFACGTESGFTIYNIEPLANVLRQDVPDCGGLSQVHMLNRTNLFALVGSGRHIKFPKNRVVIWDANLKKPVLEFTFCSPVLNVRLRKGIILVVLQKQLYAYTFPDGATQLFCYDTRDNPRGLCEISSAIDSQMCAFPGPKVGSIQLVDLDITQIGLSSTPCLINAHQHDIACITMNQLGTYVATASKKGTLIRVFEIKSRRQLIELRRGTDPASLYCLNFSADSAYLCASSDKGTVHIFAVKEPEKNKRSTLSKVGFFGQYAESQWGLANFSVQAECPCICVFGPGTSVVAICFDGSFHKYVFTKDGNCNRESYDLFVDLGNEDEFI